MERVRTKMSNGENVITDTQGVINEHVSKLGNLMLLKMMMKVTVGR